MRWLGRQLKYASKSATDTQAGAAFLEFVIFSFMAYAKGPSSAATCLFANLQSLHTRTSQHSQQRRAQISSHSIEISPLNAVVYWQCLHPAHGVRALSL